MNNIESGVIPISGIRAWLLAITPACCISVLAFCLPVHCQTACSVSLPFACVSLCQPVHIHLYALFSSHLPDCSLLDLHWGMRLYCAETATNIHIDIMCAAWDFSSPLSCYVHYNSSAAICEYYSAWNPNPASSFPRNILHAPFLYLIQKSMRWSSFPHIPVSIKSSRKKLWVWRGLRIIGEWLF